MSILSKTILVTGATGLMGTYLFQELHSQSNTFFIGHSKTIPSKNFSSIDLTQENETFLLLNTIKPEIIIHTVALTNVDDCEENHLKAYLLNVQTTKNISKWINNKSPQTRLVYISTDQVYNGDGEHREENISPSNVYALTKLWAEDTALSIQRQLVLRTNFYALSNDENKSSFADWLIDSLLMKKPVTLFTDVLFNPLYIKDLIDIMLWLIENNINGVYNIGAKGDGVSKADFALKLARIFGIKFTNTNQGSVNNSTLKAFRPKDMRMSTRKLQKIMSKPLPTIDEGLSKLHDDWKLLKGE